MITSLNRRSSNDLARGGVALVALCLLPWGTAVASEPSLLDRCFPAATLGARDGERTPIRGAPGHAQRIPKLASAASTSSQVPRHLRGAIRRVELPSGKKLVALTFDLCEQPGEIAGYDGAIFDYLRAARVKATIFAGGKWLMTHGPRSQQLIADRLIEMGSHGWAHRNVRGLAGQLLAEELQGPEAAFQAQRAALAAQQCVAAAPGGAAKLAPGLRLYRFPYGACSPQALAAVGDLGMLAIQWDVSTGDASPAQSAAAIARTIVNAARPGSIILAHANGRGYHTAAALPIAISALKAKGLEFVTVSELLAAGKPVVVDSCYDARPGDTDKYDMFFQPRRRPTEVRDGSRNPAPLPR